MPMETSLAKLGIVREIDDNENLLIQFEGINVLALILPEDVPKLFRIPTDQDGLLTIAHGSLDKLLAECQSALQALTEQNPDSVEALTALIQNALAAERAQNQAEMEPALAAERAQHEVALAAEKVQNSVEKDQHEAALAQTEAALEEAQQREAAFLEEIARLQTGGQASSEAAADIVASTNTLAEEETKSAWHGQVQDTATKRAGEACEILIHDDEDPQLAWKVLFKDGQRDWYREADIQDPSAEAPVQDATEATVRPVEDDTQSKAGPLRRWLTPSTQSHKK